MRRLFPAALTLLAACSNQAVGPSLSKRPIENLPLGEPQSVAEAPAAADAGLQGQITTLLAQAREGEIAFAALLPRARAAAAGAGAEGSERWISAQQLLSAAESARTPSTRALGELDRLISARVFEGSDSGLAELQAAQAEVAALVEEQQRAVDALRERIRS